MTCEGEPAEWRFILRVPESLPLCGLWKILSDAER
jgi:hypothetical protein